MAVGIVLAGRANAGRLQPLAPDCAWEALIPLAGRPMAAHVIAALAGVVDITQVVVAGPPELAAFGAECVLPGADLLGTLRHALEAVPTDADDLLLAAGDAPLITTAAAQELLTASRERRLCFGYPIVRRQACLAQYPGVRRTYVRLREGRFTGGNCFYVRREAMPGLLQLAEGVYAARKAPMRLAGLLGMPLLLGLLLGTARIRDAEAAATRLLGCAAGAVEASDPGIGVDVDKPDDLILCRQVLATDIPGTAVGKST